MAAEQTIRVSAKGEFGQLQRGLKQLQQDLKGVAGVVDKGAGKGGFFDEKQLRALDIYKSRFLGTMRELDAEFRKQNGVVDSLYSKLQTAQRGEREEIKKTIQQRERQLDVIRKELLATERLYNQRYRESGGYRSSSSSSGGSGRSGGSGDNDNTGGGASRLAGGALSSVLGAGKFALGLVGLSSIAGLATQAYSSAYARSVNSLDLAQRMRGQAGWSGQATDMWDHASSVGRSDRMGYSAAESWGFLDQYSRTAGSISADQQQGLLKFGRSYGLDTSEVASAAGSNRAAGGMQTPKGFADAIAGSVAKSGMTPRIVEVMETNNALLQQMNTTLKDGSSKQILAYQTTLDRIGTEQGMMQLTGAQGGNLIGGLGGIFQPGNDNWKWMGVQALRQYNPKKYGGMDLFGLEESFEDGLMNSDNVPAMAKYVKSQTGGNEKLTKRIMQRWLTDGGFAATKREASEFYDATNGLSVFNPDQMKALENGSIDSGAKYDAERQGAKGQGYMDTDARFEHALEQAGGKLVEIVMGVKEGATTVMEAIQNGAGTGNGILDSILKFMNDNLKGLATTDALGNLGSALSEVLSGKKDLFESLFGGKKTVAANATDSISFATPEQRTQYLRELQREQSNKTNSIESEGAALYERAKSGEKLSDEQMQKVYLYNAKSFSNGKQAGTIPKSSVDSGADAAAGFFQQVAQIFTNEFFGGAGDSDIGRMPGQVSRNVEDMSTIGQNKFRQMDRTTSDMAADAASKYANMERNSSSLLDKTVWIFKSMLYTVQNGTADMLAEFQSLRSSLAASNGGGLTAMGTGFSISSKITAMSGINAEQLNKKLGGVLAGKGAQFVQAGLQFGIDPAALAAISMHETGNGTSPASRNRHNVGGMMGANGLMNFASIDDGITAMARNLKVNYADKGIDTIEGVQRKYAPVGARNDPDNLNNNWSKGVVKFMNDLTGGVSTGSGSGFFNNWQDRITSKFGQQEGFRKKAHGGLDIKGAQGDQLQALAGGTVSFVKMDDGGPLDSDGKKNTRGGGTEVGIKLPDGNTYFYSHLSAVNPGLKVGQTVNTGDFIGNVGGTPGVAGSGSSTTGSHLHLGYMNSSGKLMNPVDLLNSLGAGDSDIGFMSAASSPREVRHKSEITVNLNVSGEGAKVLNASTQSQLEKLVKRIMGEQERQRLRMSPVKAGY
ncbi:M23 family metallopeptidase [Paenibacillus sp. EKM206P]|uniref:peptidoglycan DD-metalloendopeptidase family protein n=1 Tax=Paenibacillus sp. EKM206P TaxID=1683674 RepID=UPI0013EC1E6E|nr:M23 family metallopeptidase [Paenibacillus sp. EKM206P]KAF6569102.1 M23 family metallopeptidase [Paenibacillus sp. EKM206P]